MEESFTNVRNFKDIDFDMDIDGNFHEAEALFHETLGIPKLEEDEKDSDEEGKAGEGEDEEEAKKDGDDDEEEKKEDGDGGKEDDGKMKKEKKVKFLERPAAVRNAYHGVYGMNESSGEDSEEKIIDQLLEEQEQEEKMKKEAEEAA